MARKLPVPIRAKELVEIFVPSECRCGQPLPEAKRQEVLDEVIDKLTEWFPGATGQKTNAEVKKVDGYWKLVDGSRADEKNDLVYANCSDEQLEEHFEDVALLVHGIAIRLTQEVGACRINGEFFGYEESLKTPHRCAGELPSGALPTPLGSNERKSKRFLQAFLGRVSSFRDIKDLFCKHLNYENESTELATLDWPESLQDLLANNTLPKVIAGYNGFKIIHLQLAAKDLRKGQERQLIQRIRKDDPTLRALFVVSNYEQNQWHLINTKDTQEDSKTTLHLRFFRIGEGQQVRTAAERLHLIDIEAFDSDITAQELQDHHNKAFDVESVSQDFFNEISNWYFWALSQVEFPQDTVVEGEEEKHRATSLIRFLTRIIFCWFLKEKGLIPESLFNRKELEAILVDLDDDHCTYHQGILQNLFFATLNQRMGKDSKTGKAYRAFAKDEGFAKNRSTYGVDTLYRYEEHFKDETKALGYFAEVPFLNGGLFECLDRTDDDGNKLYLDGFSRNIKKRTRIPNKLFFAPLQKDVGQYLSEVYGDPRRRNSTVRGLLNILHAYNFTVEENTPVDEEIALDPELLGKVFENLLASYNDETKTTARKQTGSFYTPRPIVEYMVDESLKAHLVGTLTKLGREEVNAVEQLDLLLGYTDEAPSFSEVETDTLLEAIHTCKILDPACGSGAFPIGILQKLVHVVHKLDPENARWRQLQINQASKISDSSACAAAIKAIERDFEENSDCYGRKLYLIENCLYGVDIQPVAIQISKLRFFISLICDQKTNRDKAKNHGIRALPNLETKFVAANTLIGLPEMDQMALVDPRVNQIEAEIELLYHRHFSIQRRDQKLTIQKKLKNLRKELGQVLSESLGSSLKAQHLAAWDPFNSQASSDFFDSHWMFGRQLLDGFDIVIGNPPFLLLQNSNTSDNQKEVLLGLYYSAKYKVDLYHLFIEAGMNFLRADGVLTYITPNAFLKNKHTNKLREILVTRNKICSVVLFYRPVFEDPSVDNLIFLCQRSATKKQASENKIIIREVREGDMQSQLKGGREFPQSRILPPDYAFELDITEETNEVLQKIESHSIPFSEIGGSYFGIQSHDRTKFVSEAKLSKDHYPVIDGGNIRRYYITTPSEYLDFRPQNIKSGGNPIIYDKPRIVVRQIGRYPEGAICSKGLLTLNTIYNLYLNDESISLKYILGLINSRLISFYWLQKYYDNKPTFPKIKKQSLQSIPIKIPTLKQEKLVVDLVDDIYASKFKYSLSETVSKEEEINRLVYEFYELTPQEVAVIESVEY